MVTKMICWVDCALRDRKGIAALEYGIIAAAVIGAIGATVLTIGTDIGTLFNTVKSALANAVAG